MTISASPKPPPHLVELTISFKTIAKILAIALLTYACISLASLFLTTFMAMMMAVTLYPLLEFFRRRKFPSWFGVAIVTSGFVLTIALVIAVVLPPLFTQISTLIDGLPALRGKLAENLPASPVLRTMVENALNQIKVPDAGKVVAPLITVGAVAASGATQLFLTLIFTIYLLVDGPRSVQWMLAFFSPERRDKLTATSEEISKLVSAYVAGQAITSVICGIYTLSVLLVLGVPAALTLAVLAGIFDVLPVLGFFLAAIPAIMMGLTVSPLTALLVFTLYVLYHVIENYFLVPKIYGGRLRLSDLVVLLSLLAAGTLAGAQGAIAVLPLVASYPIIERIWLVEVLGRSVVKKHRDAAAKA